MRSVELWWVVATLALPACAALLVRLRPALAERRSVLLAVPVASGASCLLNTWWVGDLPLDPQYAGVAFDAVARPLSFAASAVALVVLSAMPRRELVPAQVSGVLLVYAGAGWVLASHGVLSLVLGYVVATLPLMGLDEQRPRRLTLIAQVLSVLLLGAGLGLLAHAAGTQALAALPNVVLSHPVAFALVVLGLVVRLGVFPFHTWLVGQFESAPFGPLLVSVAPMSVLIVVERVVTPAIALTRGEVPRASALLLIVSAVLAAAMVMVQSQLRRALGWFVVSLHSIVFLAVLDPHPVGHLGGLSMWAASTLALTGFATAVWALVTRRGDVDLTQHSGFHDDAPTLAAAFLLFGLACVGLPGTIDFVSEDLTLHGSLAHHPLLLVGFLAGVSTLGYAVLFLGFRVFLGPRPAHLAKVRLPDVLPRERAVFVMLAVLLLGAGLAPQTIARPLTAMEATHAVAPSTARSMVPPPSAH